MPTVYLALGSNLGDRDENIARALQYLNEKHIRVLKQSTIIETAPEGGVPQGKFLNCVVKGETQLSPEDLLIECKLIEQKLGRVKTIKDGPRTIDIDILLYEGVTLTTPQLTIPHPRMFKRSFVMQPLQEIDPELVEILCHVK